MNIASKILIGIGVGLAAGTVLGVLYAPAEGSETRKKIIKRSKKLAGAVNDGINEGKDSLEEIKGVLQKQLSKVNKQIEEIRS